MTRAPTRPSDPIGWCAALALGFALLVGANLAIPTAPYFDEIHYLPAARELLAMGAFTNREHPMLGKELLAIGIAVFGDNSLGWRFPSLVAGTIALYAAMRALWFATLSRFATIAYGLLLASGFFLFVHARIAMLDGFMIAFLCLAYWQLAAAMREPETGRWRLALAGVMLGLAMGAKWNAIPLAALPGLVFLVARASAGRRRLLLSRRGAPVPGITLVEAALWLGVVPLATYALTYLPGWFFARDAIEGGPLGLIGHHQFMLDLQQSVKGPHPYRSDWPSWIVNWRAIWYLYEYADGAQRGVLLIGNPLTMLIGLPALLWCAWQGLRGRNHAALGVAVIYAVALGFWVVAAKPVQFYYHYFAPSMALLAALALALDGLWQRGRRWQAVLPVAGSLALFAFFFPILAATPLSSGEKSFETYTWLDSWR